MVCDVIISFVFQDEKDQVLVTNVWLDQVSSIVYNSHIRRSLQHVFTHKHEHEHWVLTIQTVLDNIVITSINLRMKNFSNDNK